MKITGKDYIEYTLKSLNIDYIKEYKFLNDRKFRFDFFFIKNGLKIGIEYDGIMSAKSRHTSIIGFSKDCEKLNLAQINGFIVLRYTVLNYLDLNEQLNTILNAKGH